LSSHAWCGEKITAHNTKNLLHLMVPGKYDIQWDDNFFAVASGEVY